MEIRQLVPADAAQMWRLRLEALQRSPEAFASSYEEARQKKHPIDEAEANLKAEGNFTFGAFDGDQLFGMVTMIHEQRIKLRHVANVYGMFITPSQRGKGAGKALLLAVIEQARSIEGVEKINLSVVTANQSAKKLYVGLGFESFGVERKALKSSSGYDDLEYMSFYL